MGDEHYDYIRAWGKLIGTNPERLEKLLSIARSFNAPETAIYFMRGKWVTFDDIPSDITKAKVMDIVLAINEGRLQ